MEIPFSAACERNKGPILDAIKPHLHKAKSVLEIGSGTAQHALYFAQNLPHLVWQASDQAQYLAGINAQIENARNQSDNSDFLANLKQPLQLDVTQNRWLGETVVVKKFDAVYTANTLHIMPWPAVDALFQNISQVINHDALLIIYGPFKYAGQYTSASNHSFDQDLIRRGLGSGIRDFEAVDQLAKKANLNLVEDVSMPANNQCLIWQKKYQ